MRAQQFARFGQPVGCHDGRPAAAAALAVRRVRKTGNFRTSACVNAAYLLAGLDNAGHADQLRHVPRAGPVARRLEVAVDGWLGDA